MLKTTGLHRNNAPGLYITPSMGKKGRTRKERLANTERAKTAERLRELYADLEVKLQGAKAIHEFEAELVAKRAEEKLEKVRSYAQESFEIRDAQRAKSNEKPKGWFRRFKEWATLE